MSSLVALVSMAGLMSIVLAGLDQRRRELAVVLLALGPWLQAQFGLAVYLAPTSMQ